MNKNIISITFISLIFSSIFIISLYNSSIHPNLYLTSSYSYDNLKNKFIKFGAPKKDTIKIAVTSCGDNTIMEQTLVMIKSVIMFSKQDLHFIIVVEKYQDNFNYAQKLFEWPENILERITFEIILAQFPNVSDPEYFHTVFKPCASQRLFYPLILMKYDSVIHIDSDIILMSPIEQLWGLFSQMNSSQIIGMSPDNINPNTSYYKVYNIGVTRIPVPTEYSLNTGVMLMNLTRMRALNFFNDLEPMVKQYQKSIKWFVNDFLSIYLNKYPDRYMNVSCRWNYLTDHCSAGQLCPSAQTHGIALLHGSRQTFLLKDKEPAFHAIYSVFRDFQINSDLTENLIIPLKSKLFKTKDTECGKLGQMFIKSINNYISKMFL